MEILTDPEQIRQHIRDIYKPNHMDEAEREAFLQRLLIPLQA